MLAELSVAESPSRSRRGIVVGIGASAGGLKPIQTFFDIVPVDTGMSFVVVTHLHPDHKSHMVELLQAHTTMPVSQVRGPTKIEANHVYVIQPNRKIIVTDSHLETAEFTEAHGHRTPIDDFFRSLAQRHEGAAAIILSGGGTDGAVGIKTVKECGGLLLVQDPQEAEHDAMPMAAIGTGVVDAILPVRELAAKLVEFSQAAPRWLPEADSLTEGDADSLQAVLVHIQARTGHDFSHYKRSTILRRIQRRIQLNGLPDLPAYLEFLRTRSDEAPLVFNDILIGVTNFFRDGKAWDVLKEKVVPELFRKPGPSEPIRVWSVGCATGEEAYSIAILLLEEAASADSRREMLVFASDLDETSLARGRGGLYPSAIEADVSRERLDSFFVRQGNHYHVKREVREMVLFATHSILRDPPFSHLDLIVCRNLLIYLQRDVQDRILDVFHYALEPGGRLFLGTSESTEGSQHLFDPVDHASRIYAAKPWRGRHRNVPALPPAVRRAAPDLHKGRTHALGWPPGDERIALDDQHRVALELYGPPSILVNRAYEIVHISDTAGRYLQHPMGAVTTELLKLIRPELQVELRTAFFQAFERNKPVVGKATLMAFGEHERWVTISVRPREAAAGADGQDQDALIVFLEEEVPGGASTQTDADKSAHSGFLVSQLEAEIERLRHQLQAALGEHVSSSEEMKATNEELQSINEEYRSAAEELETGKEELQSINEELQAVNQELKAKLEEISRAHSDVENLMASSAVATLFLDRDLRIQRFTPATSGLFNIMPSDRGRPIAHLTNRLAYGGLVEDATQVIRDLRMIEREVAGDRGEWFLVRIRPYRTLDDEVDGVVITLTDTTKMKEVETQALELNEKLETRVVERTSELSEANGQIRDLASKLAIAEQHERRRISQVLHDDLQQRLFAVKAHLPQLSGMVSSGADLKGVMTTMDDELGEAIRITRDLSADISPMILHDEGLVDAIRSLATQMRDQYGLQVAVELDALAFELDDSLRLVLFQAIRELLFNIVKHARTSRATVTFGGKDGQPRITVHDDGRGFDMATATKDSKGVNGLIGLQPRLSLLGCELRVLSERGKGTTIEIDVKPPREVGV